jgi:hypothetical protein
VISQWFKRVPDGLLTVANEDMVQAMTVTSMPGSQTPEECKQENERVKQEGASPCEAKL